MEEKNNPTSTSSSTSLMEDDWFYDSMCRYNQLLMFNFQFIPDVLEFIDNSTFCVSGTKTTGRNEILQLTIPDKLLKCNQQDEGLCKGRDITISGGLNVKNAVNMIRTVSREHLLVTSEESVAGVGLYRFGNEKTDLLKKLDRNIPCDMVSPILDIYKNDLVLGNNTSKIKSYDLKTLKMKRTILVERGDPEILASLVQSSDNTVMCCSLNGKMYQCDFRIEIPVWYNGMHSVEHWCMAMSKNANYISQLSSGGIYILMDVRKLQDPLLRTNLGKSTRQNYFNIQHSPSNEKLISISGFDHDVYIYELKENEIKLRFTHDGHDQNKCKSTAQYVTTHGWHPMIDNLILSASQDMTLHAWEFVTSEAS